MTLKDIYSTREIANNGVFQAKIPVISFEIFPPKNDENGEKLEKLLFHLKILKKYNPSFISLTYGAGGSNQSSSLNIIKRIQNETGLNIMPHFTCVNSTRAHVGEYLEEIKALGIKNILALRGDIPEGVKQENFDFHYANELVEFIKSKTNLSIGVAGYPEGHIDCENISVDFENLKRKISAGADAIFTQMFFDNDIFFSFCEKLQDAGINLPVIPGIMTITSYSQLDRMLSMGRVTLPKKLRDTLDKYKDNPEDIRKIGIEFASKQCQQLIEAKIAGLHFYTLNSSTTVCEVLNNNLSLSVS